MSQKHIVEMQRGLDSLAGAWRGDWNDFDGRTLRDQLAGVTALLDSENPAIAIDNWLRSNRVCPKHQCWFEWCPEGCDRERADA